ncbi:MAG: hypothetical protein PHV62_03545 [Sulfuricurvum sp.]|nr:hypothetical protein [Sulfuricurvum sp.]
MKKLLLFGITSGLLLSSPIYAAKVSKVPDIITSTITGQGFLKTQGGDVKTCAGNEVYLEPSKGGNEWVSSLILSESSLKTAEVMEKLVNAGMYTKEELTASIAKWTKYSDLHMNASRKSVLSTHCDSQGNFEFNNIKNGSYAIATRVEWQVGYEKQGGVIGDWVDIKEKNQKIFLTK